MHDDENKIPTAPPIERPEAEVRAVWPTVLGVVALVAAAFESVGYIIGVVSVIAMSVTSSDFDLARLTSPAHAGLPALSIAAIVVDLLLLAALYTTGIGLLKRRRYGIKAVHILAVGAVAFSMASGVVTLLNVDKFREGDLGQLPVLIPIENLITIGTVFYGLFTLCFAAAVLAWFASQRAKREWSTWR
jgi:hypothetical protein